MSFKCDHLVNFYTSVEKNQKLQCICNCVTDLHKIWYSDAEQVSLAHQRSAVLDFVSPIPGCYVKTWCYSEKWMHIAYCSAAKKDQAMATGNVQLQFGEVWFTVYACADIQTY